MRCCARSSRERGAVHADFSRTHRYRGVGRGRIPMNARASSPPRHASPRRRRERGALRGDKPAPRRHRLDPARPGLMFIELTDHLRCPGRSRRSVPGAAPRCRRASRRAERPARLPGLPVGNDVHRWRRRLGGGGRPAVRHPPFGGGGAGVSRSVRPRRLHRTGGEPGLPRAGIGAGTARSVARPGESASGDRRVAAVERPSCGEGSAQVRVDARDRRRTADFGSGSRWVSGCGGAVLAGLENRGGGDCAGSLGLEVLADADGVWVGRK